MSDAEENGVLFSFLPNSKQLKNDVRPVRLVREYAPSGSRWAEGLDEKIVFHAALSGTEKDDRSWELRVGEGGQIYSLRGSFGESVAPQAHEGSLWNDEVWQVVSANLKKMNHDLFDGRGRPLAYFIHGSGIYLRDKNRKKPFYCPMLAEHWNEQDFSYNTLTWGQHAHVPSIYKSGALYYQRLHSPWPGVIELTYVVYNFGEDELHYYQMPWGGVRESTLSQLVMTSPDGKPVETRTGGFGADPLWKQGAKTGGWLAFLESRSDETKSAPHGLGLVYGRKRNGEGLASSELSAFQWNKKIINPTTERERRGTVFIRAGTSARNYYAMSINRYFHLDPGSAFYARVFFVVGKWGQIQETARSLVPCAGDGELVLQPEDSPLIHVRRASNGRPTRGGKGVDLFKVYAWPVQDGAPLFLLQDAGTQQFVITPDPYQLSSTSPFDNPYPDNHRLHDQYEGKRVRRPYDGNTRFVSLLGYALKRGVDAKVPQGYVRLHKVLRNRHLYPVVSKEHRELIIPHDMK